ncbi:MFS transporter [Solirubrobacter ginsenosidimutans]|uniref:MFS transporter n=1 Tax=Solirubrobacter ginsenosidimutans TaxID=490573 RepID=A0A9X3MPH2_9ACTN|nr:MFS transporter [Solirubrobacter ginsenosidimutans]MDA0159442.1 MFS transporter [Solirubrobacter ginsenosidimutans]
MQSPVPHDRRWLALVVIGIAQLMVVLDVTIVNIALPSAQRELGFSSDDRQWVITAYALAFGSLLLLGGRIADLFGRKWTFIAGLLGFAAASAVGGAADSFGVLVAARATQGAFAALLAPAALSLLTTTFTDPAERGKAFAIYAAIAGMGGAIGLLLGGALTEFLDWRWCLFVSVVFAVPAALAALRLLRHVPTPNRARLDVRGAVTASAGLFALVFGLSRAETDGWGDPTTVTALIAAAVLLTGFVLLQARTAQPLLPLRVVTDRDRGASFLAIGTASAGMFAVLLFLTFYLQVTKGFSALETGLAFLPMSFSIAPTVGVVTTKLLHRTGPRPLVPAGMLTGALGMLLLTRIGPDTAYATHVLPSLILIGIGFGLTLAPSFVTATHGVPVHDSGIASAMVSTSQQIGGSIGTALLSTLAAAAATPVDGYTTAFTWAAVILAGGAVVCGSLLRSSTRPETSHGPGAEPVAA